MTTAFATGNLPNAHAGREKVDGALPPQNVSGNTNDSVPIRLTAFTCRNATFTGILTFSLGIMTAREEFDPLAPQREAAFFYGLFLRGHDVDALRQDIDIPRGMMDKWMRAPDFQSDFRQNLQRVYAYRKQVLAIFDGLVLNEQDRSRIQ